MDKDLDMKLYNDYLNGETKAFELLYLKYKDKIKYFIYNIVKDYEKAEDITQEVFIYVLKNKVRKESSFKYYIYMIAKSRAINYIHTENRRNEINNLYLIHNEDIASEDVLDIITKQEEKEKLIEAIDSLDDKYKNAIYLVKIEEFSYKETAEILGETLQNIKNLIHRGKKELRKILIKKGFNEMNKVSKVIVLVLCIWVALSGIVYATTYIIKNVWKEPEKYNLEEESKVTEEDEEIAISEDEIDTIISEKLSWLGYGKSQVSDKHLVKFPNTKKMNWVITLKNNTSFTLNAITGELIQFSDNGFNDLEIKSTSNEDEARRVARQIYTKLGYKDGEYDIATLGKSGTGTDEALWKADFCKKYGDVFNKYQCIRISFVPEVEKIKILTVFDEDYEDNQIVITKEEAIEIAKKKYLELGKDENKIKSITVNIDIQKMNTTWYKSSSNLDNNADENTNKTITVNTSEQEMYRTPETIIRKVWTVSIDYSDDFSHIDSFYVDVTTGEIIGGETTN